VTLSPRRLAEQPLRTVWSEKEHGLYRAFQHKYLIDSVQDSDDFQEANTVNSLGVGTILRLIL
jgi:hypothetical protein